MHYINLSFAFLKKVNKYPKHHEPQNKEENKCTDLHIGFWPNKKAYKRSIKIKNQRRSTTTNRDPKYKTRMCFWADITNYCPYGRRCTFAHSHSELRKHPKYKTVLCNKFRTVKDCPYGANCQFIHFISEGKNPVTENVVRDATYKTAFFDINAVQRSINKNTQELSSIFSKWMQAKHSEAQCSVQAIVM
ncbi:Zinc finger protein 36, C3H1 type-like 3 [Trichinella sp. T8]|nr:Zinc finger protein 36, C3H1 type-like 3 [Trichinella sp. T8]